ncbi:MAG: tetratricopeptide repeat protein [Gemmatales bacterium]|nr:tetratricopeptide repeat protein [Gemmatales bacterium]MDW8387612.1 tetratricopeptide repeat protein [Gemmatales bacterium]
MRLAIAVLLVLANGTLGRVGSALAQERADRVRIYTDRTKNPPTVTTRTGTVVSEDAAKTVFMTGTGQRIEIKNTDIADILYDGEPDEVGAGRVAENRKAYEQALTSYTEALRRVNRDNKLARANIEFKIAKMHTHLADAGSLEARAKAIEALRKFVADHPDARQTIEALDMLSRLLVLDGRPLDEVIRAFQALRSKHSDNKEITNRCDLFESQLLLEEGQMLLKDRRDEARRKFEQAQTKLKGMLEGADKADALRVRIGLAQCKAALGQQEEAIKEIEAIFAEAGDDPALRAAVHLGRADCYRLNGQYREAMWDYLWVDVVYNQDREQQARALYFLHECFENMKESDPLAAARAKETRDRLLNDPRLKDTRYQKLAAK